MVFNININVTKEPVTDLNSQDSQRICNDFNCNIGVRTSHERNILQLHLDRDPLGRVVTKHAHSPTCSRCSRQRSRSRLTSSSASAVAAALLPTRRASLARRAPMLATVTARAFAARSRSARARARSLDLAHSPTWSCCSSWRS